jgi:hypothetical protein
MNRGRLRTQDVNESYYLLLELCYCEPILQQAFSIIDNVCLAHGVTAKENGRRLSAEFQHHLDLHWVSFLSASIRASHVYGFVPWRVRKLESGAEVPEVLPAGTFRWSVEVPPEKEERGSNTDAMLMYVVRLNPGQRDEKNIHITEWCQPNFMINETSVMYATVPSPMSFIIESYKHMQAAIKRQAHADAWNCTARIPVSHDPKEFIHDQHNKDIQGAFGDDVPERGMYANNLRASASTHNRGDPREQLEDAFAGRSMNHIPSVYSLPPWRHLESSPVLQPVMDIPFLQSKYKYDVCSLLGIPPDMLMTAVTKLEGNSNAKTRTQGVSRIFQAKMQRVCIFLKELCAEVYKIIYKRDAVFDMIPMPRLEVRDVEDLKILYEIGVLQPQHTLDLASILIGTFTRVKKGSKSEGGGGGGSFEDGGAKQQEEGGNGGTKKRDSRGDAVR